jgi:hypothetical protein
VDSTWEQFASDVTALWWALISLAGLLLGLALRWLFVVAWLAWWLCAVNWEKVWEVLARGGWLVVLLLGVLAALAWSQLDPGPCSFLGILTIGSFWWQLGAVGLLIGATLFCGWLQGLLGWRPAEIIIDPIPETPTGANHAQGTH